MSVAARVVWLTSVLFLIAGCRPPDRSPSDHPSLPDWAERRARMVEEIRAGGVKDERALGALGRVARHRFVPKAAVNAAYEVVPLFIGEGQTISSPFVVGFMTEILELAGDEKVLEIGTGSGYQAAVLSLLVPEVLSIEIRPSLAQSARRRLGALGYTNVSVRAGDGWKGWPEEAPFDAIIVTAAPERVPAALVEQLAPGGRMIVPVGSQSENQELILIKKDQGGTITRERVLPVRFVPMIHGE